MLWENLSTMFITSHGWYCKPLAGLGIEEKMVGITGFFAALGTGDLDRLEFVIVCRGFRPKTTLSILFKGELFLFFLLSDAVSFISLLRFFRFLHECNSILH